MNRNKTYLVEKMVGVLALSALLAWVGPTVLDKVRAADADEQAEHQQHQDAAREKRRNDEAKKLCGNGVAVWIDDTTMACALRAPRGR